MRREDLIIAAKSSTNKEEYQQLIGQVYFANLGLTMTLLKAFGMNAHNHDDYMQLSYIAFNDAIEAYKPSGNFSVLSYYRMCIKHECYKYWKNEFYYNEVDLYAEVYDSVNYNQSKEFTTVVEVEFMSRVFWERIEEVVGVNDCKMLFMRFRDQCTLQKISRVYNISAEGVRKHLQRLCIRLRQDSIIQEIAQYYHYY